MPQISSITAWLYILFMVCPGRGFWALPFLGEQISLILLILFCLEYTDQSSMVRFPVFVPFPLRKNRFWCFGLVPHLPRRILLFLAHESSRLSIVYFITISAMVSYFTSTSPYQEINQPHLDALTQTTYLYNVSIHFLVAIIGLNSHIHKVTSYSWCLPN